MSLCPAIFDCNVLAVDKARVFQTLTERSQEVRVVAGRPAAEEPNHRHRCLLRTRRERPRRRASEQRDELAAPDHSITSSAMATSDGGTERPSMRAVSALMTNSSLFNWTTGRSLAPLRMRPT